ncbi:MAG: hypothetical protein ACUVUU_00805 [bacterium]
MRTAIIGVAILLMAVTTSFGFNPGTIEIGLGGDLHLSPEPSMISANMYMHYFMNPSLGIGPYFTFERIGETDSLKALTNYSIGAIAKFYLPMTMMQGKMTPFVRARFGINKVTVAGVDENKGEMAFQVGADYWMTDNWTLWFAYEGYKLFVEGSDLSHDIKFGIATFIVK